MKHEQFISAIQDEWAMPTNKVAHILYEMEKFGLSANELLKHTDIAYETLSIPNSSVSFSQSYQLISNLLKLTDHPGLGLYLGSRENTATCGLMGYAMSCAPNIGRAIELCVTYLKASPTLTDISLSVEEEEVIFTVSPIAPTNDLLPFVIEEVLSASVRIFHLISGTELIPARVTLSYDDPGYAEIYRSTFRCPVIFGGVRNSIIYKKSILDLPTLQGNPVAEAVATKLCDQYLREHTSLDDVVQKVRRELLAMPGNFPSEEVVAERINMHPRSLRRLLKQQDTSFQKIFDSARKQLALEYLQHTQMPIENIAELVGFSDGSNFRRAFKRWTGKTPSSIRARP